MRRCQRRRHFGTVASDPPDLSLAQFAHINRTVKAAIATGEPAISFDPAMAILIEAVGSTPKTENGDAPVFRGARAGNPLSRMALLMLLRRMERKF